MILKKGAEVNCLDSFNTTPLLEASRIGNLEIVRCLLDHGADISIRNSEGMTELSCALYESHVHIADNFLQSRTNGYIEEGATLATVMGYRTRRSTIHSNIQSLSDRKKGAFILDGLKKKERELIRANPGYPYDQTTSLDETNWKVCHHSSFWG